MIYEQNDDNLSLLFALMAEEKKDCKHSLILLPSEFTGVSEACVFSYLNELAFIMFLMNRTSLLIEYVD